MADKKLLQNAVVFLMLFFSLASSAAAQNLFADITEPFANFDLSEVYDEPGRAFFIDLIIYGVIFISIAVVGLSKQFEGKKTLPVTIGIVLAAAMSMAAQRVGFRILDEGVPFAIAVFVLFVGLTLWRLFRSHEFSWNWTVIILYLLVIIGGLDDKIREMQPRLGNTAMGIFSIVFIVALIYSIMGIARSNALNLKDTGPGVKLRGPGGLFDRAARQEENETRRNQGMSAVEAKEEEAGEEELGEAEKLLEHELKDEEQVRNFLNQIERVPLTPDYAKVIGRSKGKVLLNAVKKMFKYSDVASNAVKKAYDQNYKALIQLGRELKERAVVDARAERDKLPREQKDARTKAYDNALQAQQQKNQAYLNDIKQRGLQAAEQEKQIESTLQQVEAAEKQVLAEVENLVNALNRGDTHGATSAAVNAIRSLQSAEAGQREAEKFISAARKQIRGIVGELYRTRSGLNKERLEEHYEQAKVLNLTA